MYSIVNRWGRNNRFVFGISFEENDRCVVFRDVKVNRVAKKMRCRIWHLSKSSLSPKPRASVLIRKKRVALVTR